MRVLVTGTDTGVGKTFVSCALARLATASGLKVLAFKPVETGVESGEGPDQIALCSAAGDWQRGPERGLYRFPLPAAPLVAAQAVGERIDLAAIASVIRSSTAPALVVEGAGGWRVPFTELADTSTLATLLGLPVVVVARAGLGTINHSLLTLEAVQRDNCPIAALVLSLRPEDDRDFAESNAVQIRRRWAGPVIVMADDPDLLSLLHVT